MKLEVTPLSVDENPIVNLPESFAIDSAYPNPFNSSVKLSYRISNSSHASISVYDLADVHVAELINDVTPSGYHKVTWDGSGVPSGIYIARMEVGGLSESIKLILMR